MVEDVDKEEEDSDEPTASKALLGIPKPIPFF
jgi:hypothetical protein